MYTLYIANKNYSSWSLRPWVLMRELSIPFEEKVFPFSGDLTRDIFKKFSPSGQVPCLHDGKNIVWDSLAITEYLAERHHGVWPEDSTARAWARSAAAEMHSGFGALRQQCPMNCGIRIDMKEISPALHVNVQRLDQLWSEGLSRFGGLFLTGDTFTAVDAFFAPIAFRVQSYAIPLDELSLTYVQHLLSRDSMREWESAALEEPWREEQHEVNTLTAGTLLADHRSR